MNFKRFHESKNLFDGALLSGFYKNASFGLDTSDGTVYKSIKVYLVAGTYTVSFEHNVNIVRQILDSIYSENIGSNIESYTFTTTTDTYFGISFRLSQSSSTSWDNSNIMLNTGSQPLPYEPYGNTGVDTPHYIHKTDTDTLTTLPDVIYANDNNATVGLKGNMEQSGTLTFTNPIQPQECGDITENLFELTDSSATVNTIKTLVDFGTDVTYDTFTCSCMFDNLEAEFGYGAFIDYLMDDGTHQYVALQNMLNVNDDTRVPTNVKVNGNYYNTKQNITFRKIQAYLYSTGYNKFKSGSIKWAFYSSEKKDYEPYGYKIPILSANTTMPVYLGEVESTRRIKKLVLDGTESWAPRTGDPSNVFFLEISNINFINNLAISTHYLNQDSGSFDDLQENHILVRISSSGDKTYIGLRDSNFPATAQGRSQLKEWLAQQYANGTPVTVWYVLATPTTGIVNEPLRKIGDYADTVSGITIPTTAGANTIDIDTTLKPSETTVTHKGWHPVSAVHEAENAQWD